jgi:hypothetical protein
LIPFCAFGFRSERVWQTGRKRSHSSSPCNCLFLLCPWVYELLHLRPMDY